MLDQDYGEHWFDNWDEREAVEDKARVLGIDPYDLMIIDPWRFSGYGEGACNPPEVVKLFWTDVLKSLELSYELLFAEARHTNAQNDRLRETGSAEYIEGLEERIRHLQEGHPVPLEGVE